LGGSTELPLYEYECPKDGTFEQIQKFADPPLTACPTCGGPVEKLLSAPAIQFKGTGWYITDYARKGEVGGKKEKGADTGGSAEKGAADKGASSSSDSGSRTAASSTSDSKPKGGASGDKS
jgi:putative FmdB family regulatory protein